MFVPEDDITAGSAVAPGPLYTNYPVAALYVSDPLPPESSTENKVLTFAESILISPDDIDTPLLAVMCARTSLALGPVYVKDPVAESYAKLPSPPPSNTCMALLADSVMSAESSKSVFDFNSLIAPTTSESTVVFKFAKSPIVFDN